MSTTASRKDLSEPEIIVSLIVPIYNAEAYLELCINSILNQTYKNIEIILINDGSTDSSGIIIDKFAHVDDRIKAIHKKNEGVSAARNSGIELSNGHYISFVDADDWLSPYFVELFLREALNNDADFVLSLNTLTEPLPDFPTGYISEVWTKDKTISELMYAEITIGCWNKLYRRSVIRDNKIKFDLRFFMGEGLNFIINFAQNSVKTVAINAEIYYYRKDNIKSATGQFTTKKLRNALEAIDNIILILGHSDDSIELAASYHRWHTAFLFLVAFYDQGRPSDDEIFYRSCKCYVKTNSFRLLIGSRVSTKKRALILANLLSPDLAVWAFRALWRS